MKRYGLLLLLLTGCSSVPATYLKAAAPAKLEPGWKVLTQPKAGFSIAIPPGWEEVSSGLFGSDAKLPGLAQGHSNPIFGDYVEQSNPEETLVVMSGDLTNFVMMSVTRQQGQGNQALSSLAEKVRSAFASNPMIEHVEQENMELPVGKCIRVKAEMGTFGEFKSVMTCYVLVDGADNYTASFTGLSDGRGSMPTRSIMKTFRLLHTHGRTP